MTDLLRGWLLPPSRDPATRCAATVADRFALRPPVDVRALAQNYCDVEDAAWPYECDAITVGLGHRRPQVFLRKNNAGRRRQRFSIGHELGHVIIPWHFGSIECVPDRPPLEMASGGDQESEAHRFAGALLVPRSFLDQHADRHVGAAVEALDETDISAFAAVLSLSRNLLPGFCFLVEENQEQATLIKSSGTVTPTLRPGQSQVTKFRAMAYDHGEAVVSDRRVLWFQLAAPVSFSLPADERTTAQLLNDSIAQAEGKRGDRALVMRINGIVGGLLSKEERAESAATALSVLEYRFTTSHPELEHFMLLADFKTYLRRKAQERVTRSSSLQARWLAKTPKRLRIPQRLYKILR
jgi:Zn-dependent peptidase ImmA (M78 family)